MTLHFRLTKGFLLKSAPKIMSKAGTRTSHFTQNKTNRHLQKLLECNGFLERHDQIHLIRNFDFIMKEETCRFKFFIADVIKCSGKSILTSWISTISCRFSSAVCARQNTPIAYWPTLARKRC